MGEAQGLARCPSFPHPLTPSRKGRGDFNAESEIVLPRMRHSFDLVILLTYRILLIAGFGTRGITKSVVRVSANPDPYRFWQAVPAVLLPGGYCLRGG